MILIHSRSNIFRRVSVGTGPEPRPRRKMSLDSRCAEQSQTKCKFSIDHILNVAGARNKVNECNVVADEEKEYEWLSCTRYKPPKLQRQRKREGIQRRKQGRNPRIPFSSSQVAFLEARFLLKQYLSSADVSQLAANLQLSETRVKIWFQNRRARERRNQESKAKITDAPKETASQPIQFEESCGMENVCLLQQDRIEKDNFCNPYKTIHFREMNNYMQIISPLDLSDRHLLCK